MQVYSHMSPSDITSICLSHTHLYLALELPVQFHATLKLTPTNATKYKALYGQTYLLHLLFSYHF